MSPSFADLVVFLVLAGWTALPLLRQVQFQRATHADLDHVGARLQALDLALEHLKGCRSIDLRELRDADDALRSDLDELGRNASALFTGSGGVGSRLEGLEHVVAGVAGQVAGLHRRLDRGAPAEGSYETAAPVPHNDFLDGLHPLGEIPCPGAAS